MVPNNQWVTTVTLTVVHPTSDSPEQVADLVDSLVNRAAPASWGLGAVVVASSVALVPDDDGTGGDIPDWYDRPPVSDR